MRRRFRDGTRSPYLSTTLTFEDEEDKRTMQAFLTREGRSLSGYLLSLARQAKSQEDAIARGATCVDLDVIRGAQARIER